MTTGLTPATDAASESVPGCSGVLAATAEGVLYLKDGPGEAVRGGPGDTIRALCAGEGPRAFVGADLDEALTAAGLMPLTTAAGLVPRKRCGMGACGVPGGNGTTGVAALDSRTGRDAERPGLYFPVLGADVAGSLPPPCSAAGDVPLWLATCSWRLANWKELTIGLDGHAAEEPGVMVALAEPPICGISMVAGESGMRRRAALVATDATTDEVAEGCEDA